MKKRLLSVLLAATLVFQPVSAEAAQPVDSVTEETTFVQEEETDSVQTEEETVSDSSENVSIETEETEEESALQEEAVEETGLSVISMDEVAEVQEVFVENIEGIYQTGSFKVTTSEESSEPALLGTTEEEAWENWETYIKGQLAAKSTEISISEYNISLSDVGIWYAGVINENPDLYYVSGTFYYSYYGDTVLSIKPKYLDGFDDAAFQKATAEALSILTEDMTDLEKAIALHDYIVLNCEYDYENYLNNTILDNSYSAYGVLVDRIAVCQGYALAYKYLLEKAGITCYMVTSEAMNHAWNMIQLNGNYYQVDATWDDPTWDLIGRVGHSYMFVSDNKFKTELNHQDWEVTYRNKVLSVTATDTSYDDSFWVGVTSPLILNGDNYYYVDSASKSILCIPSVGGTTQIIYNNMGTWYEWGETMSYWPSAYSGLFLIGDRLYFNTPQNICSIKLDGTDERTEFTADTSNGYIYGSAYCQGKVLYSLHQSPNLTEKEKVLTATLDGVKEVSQVTLDQTTLELEVGETVTLTATVFPADATEKTVTWSSSNTEVAGVMNTGRVQAKKAGSCVITAAAGGKSATCTVTVTEAVTPIEKLSVPVFSPEAGEVAKGTTVTLTSSEGAEIYYTTNGTVPSVVSSKYEASIVIDKAMTIKAIAVKEGYLDSDVVSASYTLEKIPVSSIKLNSTELQLDAGETATLTATILPSDATEQTVTWSSSKEETATVTQEGVVQAKQAGECVITAEADGQTANCSVVVTGNIEKLETPVFSPKEGLVKKGTEVTISGPDGAVIHYTTDATVPDEISPVYETPIVIEENITIAAYAVKEGWLDSDVVTATYQITEEELPVYTVTFIGADGKELKTEEVTQGQDATPPDETEVTAPKGYTFSGWEGNYRNVRKDETVTAKFQPVTYTITYKTNGGSNSKNNPASYTIETGTIVLEDAYGKEGYTFAGWYNNAGFLGSPVKEIRTGSTGNLTLYAKWKDERGLWMEDIAPLAYTGKAVKPENIAVYYGDKPLRAGTDYAVSYKNNINANTLSTEKEREKAPTVTITGKGNYTGSIKKTFVIAPKNLEEEDVQADNLAAAYKEGKVNRLVPVVKWGTKKLANKKDFQVFYPDTSGGAYEMPGDYEVVIKGIGNYTGTRKITLTVAGEKERLISKAKISAIPSQDYTGKAVVLTEDMPKVTYNGEPLTMDKDYTLEYGSCITPGTYEVVVKGKGIYKGVKRISFKIQGIPVTTLKVGEYENPVYGGKACTIAPEIYDKDGNLLKEGEHYKLTFSNNTQAGTAQMIITGMKQYSGTVKKNFKILPYSLVTGSTDIKAEFANGKTEQAYEKGGTKPEVKVTFKGKVLTEGVDYTVSYRNNTKVNLLSTEAEQKKAPTVIIKGKKNFIKSISMEFAIQKKDIADVFITVPDVAESTKAGKYKSSPILLDENGKKLSAGTDYQKTYEYYDADGNKLAANAFPKKGDSIKVVITGTGNYEGITSGVYKIIEKGTSIVGARVTIKNPVYYTGEAITFSDKDLEIKLGGKTLGSDDYEIIGYYNNVSKGKAQMILKGQGKYGGVKQVTFTIKAQPMKWWEKGQ